MYYPLVYFFQIYNKIHSKHFVPVFFRKNKRSVSIIYLFIYLFRLKNISYIYLHIRNECNNSPFIQHIIDIIDIYIYIYINITEELVFHLFYFILYFILYFFLVLYSPISSDFFSWIINISISMKLWEDHIHQFMITNIIKCLIGSLSLTFWLSF